MSRSSTAIWMPSSVSVGGIRMSVSTTSGRCSAIAARSVAASAQAATTSMSSRRSSIRWIPSRTTALSSPTTTRMVIGSAS